MAWTVFPAGEDSTVLAVSTTALAACGMKASRVLTLVFIVAMEVLAMLETVFTKLPDTDWPLNDGDDNGAGADAGAGDSAGVGEVA